MEDIVICLIILIIIAGLLALPMLVYGLNLYDTPTTTEPTEVPTEVPTEEPTSAPTNPISGYWKSLGEFRLTAYCPCQACSCGYGTMTSTGTVAQSKRTIAVDPTVIPYQSRVLIDGIIYIAEDCGSLVKDKIVDIFFDTHKEVDAFGVQYSEIYIWIE